MSVETEARSIVLPIQCTTKTLSLASSEDQVTAYARHSTTILRERTTANIRNINVTRDTESPEHLPNQTDTSS